MPTTIKNTVDEERLYAAFGDLLKLLMPLTPEERRRAVGAAVEFFEIPIATHPIGTGAKP